MRGTTRRFEGFPPSGLRFLAALEKHNERPWFAARKERYENEVLLPMRAFVADASEAFARIRLPLCGDAKRSIFRVYRDIRFRADKRPYRTSAAAYLSYDGGRDTPGGLYLHVAPERCYMAIAFYRIERPMLQRWRLAMRDRPRAFGKVVRALERRGLSLLPPEERDDSLVRLPHGFGDLAGHEFEEYFRLRSFTVRRELTRREVETARLVESALAFGRAARPLLEFGWSMA